MLGTQGFVKQFKVRGVQTNGHRAALVDQHVQRLANHGQQGLGLAAQLLAHHLTCDVAGQVQQLLGHARLQLLEVVFQALQHAIDALRTLAARAVDMVVQMLLPLLLRLCAAFGQALCMTLGSCLLQHLLQLLLVESRGGRLHGLHSLHLWLRLRLMGNRGGKTVEMLYPSRYEGRLLCWREDASILCIHRAEAPLHHGAVVDLFLRDKARVRARRLALRHSCPPDRCRWLPGLPRPDDARP